MPGRGVNQIIIHSAHKFGWDYRHREYSLNLNSALDRKNWGDYIFACNSARNLINSLVTLCIASNALVPKLGFEGAQLANYLNSVQ